MRNWIQKLLCICFVLVNTGCGSRYGANIHTDTGTSSVATVLEENMAEADGTAVQEETPAEEPAAEETAAEGTDVSYDSVEIDLTAMSATMVYSEVYNMLTQPDSYLGRTVKMAGQYTEHYNEMTDKTYYACIILDATACCAQGMEFALADGYEFSGKQPAEGDMICVAGVYSRYEEDGFPYYTLRDAVYMEG